jgi:rod shape-determining protein MreD
VKVLRVFLVLAAALTLQATLARFLVRGSIGVDLVLVAVVFLGLTTGPTVGLLSGTAAGLVQDALATAIVGIGGLGKTTVGFLAGWLGSAFIVAQPVPRFCVFFGATVVQMTIAAALHAALDAGPVGVGVGAIVAQALGNALVGLVFFQLVEGLPRAIERRRAMERGRGRRK